MLINLILSWFRFILIQKLHCLMIKRKRKIRQLTLHKTCHKVFWIYISTSLWPTWLTEVSEGGQSCFLGILKWPLVNGPVQKPISEILNHANMWINWLQFRLTKLKMFFIDNVSVMWFPTRYAGTYLVWAILSTSIIKTLKDLKNPKLKTFKETKKSKTRRQWQWQW